MSNQLSKQTRQELSSELAQQLRIVGDHSEDLIESHLKPFGLSISQGYLFGLIADWVLKGLAPLQKDLEKDMRRATSSITSLIQGLERKGLIFRVESATDGRAKELHITDKGWKLREELGRDREDWQKPLTKSITDEELAAVVALLRKLGPHSD